VFVILVGFNVLPSGVLRAQSTDSVLVLSPRIGAVVGRYERNYFGLFPAIRGFQTCRFIHSKTDSILAKIERAQLPDTTVSISAGDFSFLKNYIDDYERLAGKYSRAGLKHRTARYEDLVRRKVLRKSQPCNRDAPWVNIVFVHHATRRVKILHATDSVLVFTSDESVSFISTTPSEIHTTAARKIQWINCEGTANFGMTFLYYSLCTAGALSLVLLLPKEEDRYGYKPDRVDMLEAAGIFGASVGLIAGLIDLAVNSGSDYSIQGNIGEYQKHLDALKSNSVFPGLPPPEIRAIVSLAH
jgi:hypothetical protein